MVDPFKIIEKYYDKRSRLYRILTIHGALVMRKALAVADRLPNEKVDRQFLKEAAMLHDIGIFLTHAPDIDCHEKKHYLFHGYLGAQLLRKHKLFRHARVCERHVGVGLRAAEAKKLGLPIRAFLPLTLEEQIICFADKFYSKNPDNLLREKSVAEIRKGLAKYGQFKVKQFDAWLKRFG